MIAIQVFIGEILETNCKFGETETDPVSEMCFLVI
jgi:hypothetical protein